ncbi:cysteine peptidase family C39 domain-containing protein [Aquimarina sp. AU119]|uniref:cysteine peptidase family C39 domain-containing protein n=1 Tax=Aquimarina sp. AU119 TaxID=2108528 RepID=UPI000D69246F|nr:cysteine peptidase family C39 domain-containing protein [Aquimarina sp. AU119]
MRIKLLLFLLIITTLLGCNNSVKNKDFPILLQETPVQCGPVCLKMISQYYGKDVEINELEKLSGMESNGTSLLGLSEAAESIGLKNLGVKISFEQLVNEAPLPAIVHWNSNHYVVVYEVNLDSVSIADPAHGKIKYSKKEFCDGWLKGEMTTLTEGVALLLEKTTNF